MCFRGFRHGAVSALIRAGVDPVRVAKYVGDRVETTLSTYAHEWEAQGDDNLRSRDDNSMTRSLCCVAVPTQLRPSTRLNETRPQPGPLSFLGSGLPSGVGAEPSGGLEPPTPSLPWRCSTN